MLPAVNRLKKAADVSRVLATTTKHRIGPLLFFEGAVGEDQFKLAIVISKKVDKRAVTRNRLRRVISEEFRLLLPQLEQYKREVVVVVLFRPENDTEVFHKSIQKWLGSLSR